MCGGGGGAEEGDNYRSVLGVAWGSKASERPSPLSGLPLKLHTMALVVHARCPVLHPLGRDSVASPSAG